jgi:hypothetical protein
MNKGYQLLLIVLVIVGLASCQKELSQEGATPPGSGPAPADTIPTTPGTGTEVGSWKFVSLQGIVSQTAEFNQASTAIKAISTSNFTSQNNAGTITFDSVIMNAMGVTMTINTTAKTLVYMNGSLFDSLQTPLNQTLPAQDASSGYKKIGSDSLYFQDGGFLNVLTGGMLPSSPTGCKLKFEGNLMKMTVVYDTVTTQDYQGIPAKLTIHGVLVATLKKN